MGDWKVIKLFSSLQRTATQIAKSFNDVQIKKGGIERLVELLKVVDPNLLDLRLGFQDRVFAEFVQLSDLIPISQLGDGFVRLLSLFSEILFSSANVILIDEVETGLHHSTLKKVWKGIAAIARQQDLQIFATTHSYECIRAAHEAISESGVYDLALHRLERTKDGHIKAVTYDRETLDTSFKVEFEVR